MKFYIKKRAIDDGTYCEYSEGERSLITNNICTDGSLLINNTYLTIDFDTNTKMIKGISGYLGNIKSYKSKNIQIPIDCVDGGLFIDDFQYYKSGIGYDFGFNGRINYDLKNKLLVISDDKKILIRPQWNRIAENIFVYLNRNELSCICIRIVDVK